MVQVIPRLHKALQHALVQLVVAHSVLPWCKQHLRATRRQVLQCVLQGLLLGGGVVLGLPPAPLAPPLLLGAGDQAGRGPAEPGADLGFI